tara:strand:- start:568 stop:918 length:351 start_codon:yes stop_codon:yes gene_type:complete
MAKSTNTTDKNAKTSVKTINAIISQVNNPKSTDLEILLYLSNEWRNTTKPRLMKKYGISHDTTTDDVNSFRDALNSKSVMMTEGETLQFEADKIISSTITRGSRLQNKYASNKVFK